MQKLVLILLTFFAVFTFLRVFETAEATETVVGNSVEIPVKASVEIPMEIIR